IAINCATYVGYTVTGNIIGSALATLSVCLPPLSIMLLLTRWYQKVKDSPYTRSILDSLHIVMAAMIGTAMLMFLNHDTFTDWKSIVLFVAAMGALYKRVSPITLIILAAVAGLLLY
ncbi:MAG: chromate transporter, partial [Bacteroidales bacterium]|nr:chromate transporter [Bacteroidales bacterium]